MCVECATLSLRGLGFDPVSQWALISLCWHVGMWGHFGTERVDKLHYLPMLRLQWVSQGPQCKLSFLVEDRTHTIWALHAIARAECSVYFTTSMDHITFAVYAPFSSWQRKSNQTIWVVYTATQLWERSSSLKRLIVRRATMEWREEENLCETTPGTMFFTRTVISIVLFLTRHFSLHLFLLEVKTALS